MNFRPLEAGQLVVGEPARFDVYDDRGRLLLRKGTLIASAAQEARLAEQGGYVDEQEDLARIDRERYRTEPGESRPQWVASFADRKVSVVQLLAGAQGALGDLLSSSSSVGFGERVLEIVDVIRKVCRLDPDAALGCIVVQRDDPYPIRHQVDTALLSDLMLEAMGAPEDIIRDTLAAALTMNISMLEIQQFLYDQKEPLDSVQNATVRTHPLRGARALQALGVSGKGWLASVAQHHERLDGSGYPMGLRDDAICLGARVIALADQYCALVSERSYRDGLNPALVSGKFRNGLAGGFDPDALAAMLRVLGVYPPGAVVRLAGGQVGIVCRRTQQAQRPIVMAWLSPQGMRYETGRKRPTSDPLSAVDSAVSQGTLKPLPAAEQLWTDAFDVEFPASGAASGKPA